MMERQEKLAIAKVPPLYLRIYQILKEAIVRGDFAPGEQMIETKLAEELKVSRTPIRDALRQLAKDGLILPQENGIAIVYSPTVFDVAEVYVTRAALEAQAAAILANNISNQMIQELQDIVSISEEAHERGDVNQVVNCNTQFHEKIIHASQNEKIVQTIGAMHLLIVQVRRTSLIKVEHRSTSLQEHNQIIQALKGGDSLSLQQIVSQHILKAGGRLVQVMGIPTKPNLSIQYLLKNIEAEVNVK